MRRTSQLVALFAAALLPTLTARAAVFVNEIDYDQPGATDTAEFIELAGTAGTNLAAYTLELVNGATDTVYATIPLPNFTFANETGTGWGFFVLGRPSVLNNDLDLGADNFIQNGAPDGVRLLLGSAVVHYVAYEPLSSLPGVTDTVPTGTEDTNFDPGASIHKTGTGAAPDDFTWSFAAATPGTLNPGQTLIPEPASLSCLAASALLLATRRRRRTA